MRKLERARRDARRFAADARRLAARAGARLPKGVARGGRARPAEEVDAVASGGDPERLSAALHSLDGLWNDHLAARARSRLWREYAEVGARRGRRSRCSSAPSCSRPIASRPARWPRRCSPAITSSCRSSRTGCASRSSAARLAGTPPRRGDVIVFESPGSRGGPREAGRGRAGRRRRAARGGPARERRPPAEEARGRGRLRGAERGARRPRRRDLPALPRGARPRPPLLRRRRRAALEARWDAAAAAGVATYEVLQCSPAARRRARARTRASRPGTSSCSGTTATAPPTAAPPAARRCLRAGAGEGERRLLQLGGPGRHVARGPGWPDVQAGRVVPGRLRHRSAAGRPLRRDAEAPP